MKNKEVTIELLKTYEVDYKGLEYLTHNVDFSKIQKEVLDYTLNQKALYSVLAQNPTTPSEALERLLECKIENIDFWVAQHPNISSNIVNKLLNHESTYIRSTLAKNTSLPKDLFSVLAKDDSFFVHLELIRNPNTPLDDLILLLIHLSNSEENFVREEVALHPLTPVDILEQLFKDEMKKVQINVLKNVNAPIGVLLEAFGGEDQLIKNFSKKNPKMSDFKTLDDEIIVKEDKIEENKKQLENLTASLNIPKNSKLGRDLLWVYIETQDKLNDEILKLKENIENLKEVIYLKQEENSITRD